MTGIDISGVQPDDVPGVWEFIVVKTTEGLSLVNPRAAAQWAHAGRTTRGVYHYARPSKSDGAAQAKVFADDAVARGFKPGVDLWQLDAEDGLNGGVAGVVWRQFIIDFMTVAALRLGRRGFLYAGWPFLQAHGLTDLPYRYMWWLPAYGPNDGADHGFGTGVDGGLVVIHQFTSHGGLDQNKIVNPLAYGPSSAPQPAKPQGSTTTTHGAIVYNPPLTLPKIASSLDAPGGGTWLLAIDGSIWAVGTAPYYGGANGQAYFKGRTAQELRPFGKGYTIVATSKETYDFPPR